MNLDDEALLSLLKYLEEMIESASRLAEWIRRSM